MSSACQRTAMLASVDCQCDYDHIKNANSKKKLNLLCSKEDEAVNLEWLKLLKGITEKLKDLSGAYTSSKNDETKTWIFALNLYLLFHAVIPNCVEMT